MGLFKRLMGCMGYVKLAEYGLELTEDGVVPVADDFDDDPDGPYAVGSIVGGEPVPDSDVLSALEAQMTASDGDDLGIADTQKVYVENGLEEEDTDRVKFLEADTIPAKKI
jgi:hypothetical protein